MFLLSKSPYDHVARETLEGAQAAIAEGYILEGECDETYKVTKPLKELPKEEKPKPKAEPKPKAKARK
ncbi:MAG: hypothetical protein WC343_05735 [Bacilli bacterium]|jgi:hypothetical protein